MDYTDPPDMPEDERMTDAELKTVREFLGFTGEALAAQLGVSSRTVRHWEAGRYPIPDGVRLAVEELERYTAEFVGRAVDALLDMAEPAVLVYRNDAEYHAAVPSATLPASWHRAVVARVAQEVPGLVIAYPARAAAPSAPASARAGRR